MIVDKPDGIPLSENYSKFVSEATNIFYVENYYGEIAIAGR